MKIAVVGPGALGCLWAASLAEAGQDVVLMDYRPERAEFITRRGLVVEREGRERRTIIRVSVDPDEAARTDLVMICVKAYQTEIAVKPLRGRLKPETRVLTLQNGVGNVETLAQALGRSVVWGGITAQGATELGLGQIRHAGAGETVIGALAEGEESRLQETADVFNRAGLPTRVEGDVQSVIWSKLIVNVGINPLTAILHLRNGQLLEYDDSHHIMAAAVAEAVAVARAAGITLIFPDPLARVEGVARATSGNVASMLQDILAKRRTEIDFINGAISDRGRELGLPTPVNDTLTALVKTMESSYGRTVS